MCSSHLPQHYVSVAPSSIHRIDRSFPASVARWSLLPRYLRHRHQSRLPHQHEWIAPSQRIVRTHRTFHKPRSRSFFLPLPQVVPSSVSHRGRSFLILLLAAPSPNTLDDDRSFLSLIYESHLPRYPTSIAPSQMSGEMVVAPSICFSTGCSFQL